MVGFSDATRAQFTKVVATPHSSGMYSPWLWLCLLWLCILWPCILWLCLLWLYDLLTMAMPTLAIFAPPKVAATSLSSGTIGQCFVGMMVNGPKEGEPSYALFAQECHSELVQWLHLCSLLQLYEYGCTHYQESADIMVGLKRRALQATSAPHTPATYPSHIHLLSNEPNN